MNLLTEIFKWIKTLPLWQQDAARRLYEKPDGLSEQDYLELYRLALKENGLADDEVLTPKFVEDDSLQKDMDKHTLVLKSLGNLRHVNKIDSSQTISFSPTGMTVVYGNNGSGKSGYARVFKRACFCRDSEECVLPDVENYEERDKAASATFEIEYDDVCKKIDWINGRRNPELACVSVFDSRTARIVLDSDQEPRYIPYGLDILTSLGSVVLPRVKQEIDSKWKSIDISEDCFSDLRGETRIGALFSNLAKVSFKAVSEAGTWTYADMERGKYLTKFLSDNNYPARIKENNFILGRLSAHLKSLKAVTEKLSNEAVIEYKKVYKSWETAKEAEKLSIQTLLQGEDLLVGTGSDAWKLMFYKAQDYIVGEVDNKLGVADLERCPLCQQKIDSNTRARLNRFTEYILDKVTIELKATSSTLDKMIVDIVSLDENAIPVQTNIDEIEHLSPGFEAIYKKFVAACACRKSAIRDALRGNHDWGAIPLVEYDISSILEQIKTRIENENADLEKSTLEYHLDALTKERDELRARYKLSQKMSQVKKWFEQRELRDALRSVSHSITTLVITNKIKEFSEAAISAPLQSAVAEEFKKLGIANMRLRPAFVPHGRKGRLVTSFELGVANPQPISAVLSEGEQKAIAIASFMAELGVSGHKHAVVFDDPMTSLDHMRRKKVAERMAHEAIVRQVLVFSHEPVFVTMLKNKCEGLGVPCSVQSLSWNGNMCGFVAPGIPWDHKSVKERISELKQAASSLRKVIGEYPNEEHSVKIKGLYGRLRATIELTAQEVCLRGTVQRFSDQIRMAKLTEILPLDKDAINDLYTLFGKCSDIFEGHDHASAANEPPPMPTELQNDIASLETIIARIKSFRAK